MKFLSVVGARPQFIKAGPLSTHLRAEHSELLVHTGQHYDDRMSGIFFEELGLPPVDFNLDVGSGSHAEQTAAMLVGLERIMLTEQPDVVIVYGDTNSTLAGALAAAKVNIPIAHVEAGLRSFNRRMPEEVNRVVTDHLSRWLFVPSGDAQRQLSREGIVGGVHVVGDIMLDAVLLARSRISERPSSLVRLGLEPQGYFLCTIHRAENTDNPDRLRGIMSALGQMETVVVLPLHPRTRARLESFRIDLPERVRPLDPLGYLDMLQLQQSARAILTDSGGVQKEAYYLKVPCITLRDETEWVETVATGWNTVVGTSATAILTAARSADTMARAPHPPLYGDGRTAVSIAAVLTGTSGPRESLPDAFRPGLSGDR